MHRQIGTAFFQGHFEFFDKQALAAHFAQRTVEDLVALGGHAQDVHLMPHATQQVLHVVGLPEGQTTFAGGDGEVNGIQNRAQKVLICRADASMGTSCQNLPPPPPLAPVCKRHWPNKTGPW